MLEDLISNGQVVTLKRWAYLFALITQLVSLVSLAFLEWFHFCACVLGSQYPELDCLLMILFLSFVVPSVIKVIELLRFAVQAILDHHFN